MDGFAFVHRDTVRFRDLDAMGHINNAVFATYVEQARIEYLRHLGVLHGPLYQSIILARIEIDYRAPGEAEGEVEVGVRPARSGTRSFDLEYELRQGGRTIAQAKTVLVAYDYERAESMELPSDWRRSLAA